MKTAVGINPTTALGQAVVEARRQLGHASDSMNSMPAATGKETDGDVEYSSAEVDVDSQIETIPLQKKKPPPPR
jgi:hypothetical protein